MNQIEQTRLDAIGEAGIPCPVLNLSRDRFESATTAQACLDRLWVSMTPQLLRVARRYSKPCAADIVQDTYIRLLAHVPTLESESHVAAMLMLTCRSIARNYARATRRQGETVDIAVLDYDVAPTADTDRWLQAIYSVANSSHRQVINGMDKILRTQPNLGSTLEELYQETAKAIGVSLRTVKYRLKELRDMVIGKPELVRQARILRRTPHGLTDPQAIWFTVLGQGDSVQWILDGQDDESVGHRYPDAGYQPLLTTFAEVLYASLEALCGTAAYAEVL